MTADNIVIEFAVWGSRLKFRSHRPGASGGQGVPLLPLFRRFGRVSASENKFRWHHSTAGACACERLGRCGRDDGERDTAALRRFIPPRRDLFLLLPSWSPWNGSTRSPETL